MSHYLSTAALGMRPLDDSLCRGAAFGYDKMVLTVGALPVPNIARVILNSPIHEFSVHHNAPIGENEIIYARETDKMIAHLKGLNIKRYSQHPPFLAEQPSRRQGFFVWAREAWEKYRTAGISFSLETMYPIKHRGTEKPCWLYSPENVFDFLEFADRCGWERPLVADVSHMHIAGWKDENVTRLANDHAHQIAELHYSANNGVHDQHRVMKTQDVEYGFFTTLRDAISSEHTIIVREERLAKPKRRTP